MTDAELQQQAESALEALAEAGGVLAAQSMLEDQGVLEGVSLEGVLAQQSALDAAHQMADEGTVQPADDSKASIELHPTDRAQAEEAMDTSDAHLEPKEEPSDETLASLAQTLANASNNGGDAAGEAEFDMLF